MMTANELRIGNIIKFNNLIEKGKTVTVNARFFSSLAAGRAVEEMKPDELINNYYQPIPLTPELLVDLGFSQRNNLNETSRYYKYGSSSMVVGIKIENGFADYVFAYSDKIDSSHISVNHIKYLHQLQNFYYALTGEEFELTDVLEDSMVKG